LLNLAFDVSGLAAGPTEIFEPIVVRLELVIGDAPILNGQVRIDEALAITLLEMGLVDEIDRLKAIRLAIPMHQRAAQTGSRQVSDPSPHRQRGLIRRVAGGHCFLDVVLHQGLADREPQFVVDRGGLKVGHGVAR
jgi:hypothetical protein